MYPSVGTDMHFASRFTKKKTISNHTVYFFDVLLIVLLSIFILVIFQLDTQNFVLQ